MITEFDVKNVTTEYAGEKNGIKLTFTVKDNDTVVYGNFSKGDVYLGSTAIMENDVVTLNLQNEGGDFVADFKVCVDLVKEAKDFLNNVE